ncbi:MAG: DegT/DnrJ/EryC1/StrS family aminotransferase [Candidatus Aminicenantales bacterium]
MANLALFGAEPVRTKLYPMHNPIGEEEKRAAIEVIESGVLSQFIGSWHPDFYGGKKVQALERAWAEFVGAKHAVSVNSNTSGLLAAVGAAGVGPGDEVIVPPYTMSATATAVIGYNAIPVFADIRDDIFCLDPASVRKRITPRTKAIIAVHLFGHPADMDPLLGIAREHNLVVIEDAAQAPGGIYKGRKVGALGDMTVFSLNFHKHIHTGEGGIVTTNSDYYAERLQLIRNHGEVVVGDKGVTEIINTFGFNLRLTEIQAAIGLAQLEKLPRLLEQRIANANYLSSHIGELPGIQATVVYPDCKHVYYVQPFMFDEEEVGVSRDRFVEAIAAELPTAVGQDWHLVYSGYATPLYLQPMYQQQIAYGASGCPFKCPLYKGNVDYRKGLCPVTERIEEKQLIGTEFMRPPATPADMRDVVCAFEKVYEHRRDLAQ